MRAAILASTVALALGAGTAAAHHGWGGYDATQVLTLTGTVKQSAFENPHGELQLETQGKVWRVVLAPPFRMQNRGPNPANQLRLRFTVPLGASFVSIADATCAPSTGAERDCSAKFIEAGEARFVSVFLARDGDGATTMTAETFNGDFPDPDRSNNTIAVMWSWTPL